jgi:RimJ/RimL family protein N-acetyltransferase
MSSHSTPTRVLIWRAGLPVLTGEMVTLREPTPSDCDALVSLLSLRDAGRFGLDRFGGEADARRLVDAAVRDRAAGLAFTYLITLTVTSSVVGILQIRRLDPTFEAAEWECSIAPSSRGTGVFVDAARAAIAFAFESAGIHRLEARVAVDNGRANGALRKLGAVHEGILRSAIRRDGAYADQALWALLKDEWGSHWAPDAPWVH